MSSFNYIAILGRQPEFGLVELESMLGGAAVEPLGRQAALLEQPVEVARLGGTVKLGRVLYDGPVVDLQSLPVEAAELPMRQTKTPFAVSVYAPHVSRAAAMAAGLELKKRLRERGSVRLITTASGTDVSAAQLSHNRVLADGFELLVVVTKTRMVVAMTTGVQDIDWYSERDYGRPARSATVGMLPPKLAQILVNTTTASVVADPFCGTGVVLAESLLAGRSARGSDVAPEMVAASRENVSWLALRVQPRLLPAWDADSADARTVRLPENCAVVSEGYLGPNLSHSPAPDRLVAIKKEILALYRDSLTNWARQLPSGAEVSLCVPAWRVGRDWQTLGLVDDLTRLGYTLKSFDHVRNPLLYARDNQVVGRQILFLRND